MRYISKMLRGKTPNEIGDLVVVLVCLSWSAGVVAGYILRLAE